MSEPQTPLSSEPVRRRRRKAPPSSRRATYRDVLASVLRNTAAMDRIMLVAALAFLGAGYWQFKNELRFYADMFIPSSQADLVYLFGKPTTRTGDDRSGVWTYVQDGRELSGRFDNGQLDRVECRVTAPIGTCPAMLGIAPGTTEEEVRLALGSPTAQVFAGNNKTLRYADIGVDLELTRFHVFAIAVSGDRDGFFGYLARFVRAMLP